MKFADTEKPNLSVLCRGNQKAALLEYYEGGGRRRFALGYSKGMVFLWNTEDFRRALRKKQPGGWTNCTDWDNPRLSEWLITELEK